MVLCINPIVTDHFKVSVRDMYNQAFDKVNGGDAFGYSFMVLMALIVEGHRSPIIGINPGSGNDGPAQISADIFNSDIRGARIGFGPDIKPIGMVFVNLVFKFLKRRSQFKGELLQKDFTESQAQEAIGWTVTGKIICFIQRPPSMNLLLNIRAKYCFLRANGIY